MALPLLIAASLTPAAAPVVLPVAFVFATEPNECRSVCDACSSAHLMPTRSSCRASLSAFVSSFCCISCSFYSCALMKCCKRTCRSAWVRRRKRYSFTVSPVTLLARRSSAAVAGESRRSSGRTARQPLRSAVMRQSWSQQIRTGTCQEHGAHHVCRHSIRCPTQSWQQSMAAAGAAAACGRRSTS